MSVTRVDIAIVGAGIAGASLAAMIGTRAAVVLIEAESQPGYHSTGRSAAFWSESYGGPLVQPLTTASRAWLEDGGFLHPRGCIHIADDEGRPALALLADEMALGRVARDWLDRPALEAMIPGLRPGFTVGLSEPTCRDIDVGGLHGDFLARARRTGATLLADAAVTGIVRERGDWRIATRAGEVRAQVTAHENVRHRKCDR